MKQTDQVTYVLSGRCLIVQLPYEVDDHTCRGVREDTESYIRERKINRMIFDFSRTGFMDSAGIGVLLSRYRRMKELGGDIYLSGADAKVSRLLRISGIYQIMESI
ncbi:MAG: anti-sigma factor antagonist [Lachnospiraceae bacterium]|nr:anti-sigma factor antagonist [Lachnospiraceae bacterium]